MLVVDEYQLQSYLDKGFEFVTVVTDDQVIEHNITEQYIAPQISIGNTYQQSYNQPQTLQKSVPVVVRHTRFLVRRTVAAKTLFESKQNENN